MSIESKKIYLENILNNLKGLFEFDQLEALNYLTKFAQKRELKDFKEEDKIKNCAYSTYIQASHNQNLCYVYGRSDSIIIQGVLEIIHNFFKNESLNEKESLIKDLEDFISQIKIYFGTTTKIDSFSTIVEKIKKGLEVN